MTQKMPSSPRKAATPEPVENVKPMPFPGESPTVSLAMAAARMYGLQPEEEKPARAKPKRRAAATKKKPAVAATKARKPARAGKAKTGTKAKRAKSAR